MMESIEKLRESSHLDDSKWTLDWITGPISATVLREAADTIESLRERLQEENDALRDYRASQIAVEAERRLQEIGGQACHATQPNYEHCKYSTNRGWSDTSRYAELFGTPERAARTLEAIPCGNLPCSKCPMFKPCCCDGVKEDEDTFYDVLLEWLRGDAE